MGSSSEVVEANAHRFELEPVSDEGRRREVLEELCQANEAMYRRRGRVALPSREVVAGLIDDLRAVLYPVHLGSGDASGRGLRHRIGVRLDKARGASRIRYGAVSNSSASTFGAAHPVPGCARRSAEVTGRGATIGGNVWLTRSVPPGSRVHQVQARQETFENGSGI